MTDWAVAWSKRLENVLQDRAALDAFRGWLSNTDSAQPLELHFAIRAYLNMVMEKHPKCVDLACSIYTRYISLRTGCCSFIPGKLRQECGIRVKTLPPAGDPRLFEPIVPFVDNFLRRQHEQFCMSEEFVEAFNRVSIEDNSVMSTSISERTASRMNTSTHSSHGSSHRSRGRKSQIPFLTAETLLKSQHDRETTLGESHVERMYPGPRMPYVCHATTSQHDSAVSSSFSSDANRSIRLSSIREEQLRGNPSTYTIPRVERELQLRIEGQQFDHDSEEGRRFFFTVLSKKLNRENARRRRNETTERQIKELEMSRNSARDVIISAECDMEDEDDLERYVERMREDSEKASANRSPRGEHATPFFPPSRVGFDSTMRSIPIDHFDGSLVSHSVDPPSIGGFAPPSFSRFAPPPTGFNTLSTSDGYYKQRANSSSRQQPVYDSSGIESSTSEDRKRRDHRQHRRSHGHNTQLLTISYKGADGVPVVAHVPTNGMITLKEFRRHFSISSHANMQFFFKTDCDDGSAPYQLLLINDDAAILPLFQGKVTAECKQVSPE